MDANKDSGAASGSDAQFVPREDLIKIILELGFTRNAAIKSLFYTGNYNAELAAGWLFENSDKDLDGLFEDGVNSDMSDDELMLGPDNLYKMVCVVNCQLNMGGGKIATQVAHAALGLYRNLIEDQLKYAETLINWEQLGETIVVVKGDNVTHLQQLATKAESKQLPNYVVHDAGKTQIAAGSTTVLAIIGKVDIVDEITGKLKLL